MQQATPEQLTCVKTRYHMHVPQGVISASGRGKASARLPDLKIAWYKAQLIVSISKAPSSSGLGCWRAELLLILRARAGVGSAPGPGGALALWRQAGAMHLPRQVCHLLTAGLLLSPLRLHAAPPQQSCGMVLLMQAHGRQSRLSCWPAFSQEGPVNDD